MKKKGKKLKKVENPFNFQIWHKNENNEYFLKIFINLKIK